MTPPRRTTLPVWIAAACVLLGLILMPTPAVAAPYSGHIELKGPGTVYSPGPNTLVAEAVAAAPGTATYEVRVVNTGSQVTQFNIRVTDQTYGATANLYSGSLLLTPMSSGPDGYWTAPIAPGRYQALVLKVAVSQSYPPQQLTYLDLRAADGTYLGRDTVATQIASDGYGYGPTLTARQGSQRFVGGPYATDEHASSPALNTGQSARFNVRVRNLGGTPEPVRVRMYGLGGCVSYTVMDGTVDVTLRVMFYDNYSTPVLAPGATRNLTVIARRVVSAGCAPYERVSMSAFVADYSAPPDSMFLLVPLGPA